MVDTATNEVRVSDRGPYNIASLAEVGLRTEAMQLSHQYIYAYNETFTS